MSNGQIKTPGNEGVEIPIVITPPRPPVPKK